MAARQPTASCVCPQCGESFRPKSCSVSGNFRCPSCRAAGRRQWEHCCERCGHEWSNFRRGSPCPKCSRSDRLKAERPKFVCRGCGKTCEQTRSDCKTFCSRECAFAEQKRQAAIAAIRRDEEKQRERERREPKTCIRCGERKARSILARYCLECRKRKKIESVMRYITPAPTSAKRCRVCGVEFQARRIDVYCGKKCHNRARKLIRRKQCKGGDKINALEVFARDGWKCQLCGRKVKRNTRGYHPLAPSLDHIVPVSDGGKHAIDNVQCAHIICNSLKSNSRGNGQLRLFG